MECGVPERDKVESDVLWNKPELERERVGQRQQEPLGLVLAGGERDPDNVLQSEQLDVLPAGPAVPRRADRGEREPADALLRGRRREVGASAPLGPVGAHRRGGRRARGAGAAHARAGHVLRRRQLTH